ncbi:MAG: ABC transporter permease [Dehalococcoidia bacterium]
MATQSAATAAATTNGPALAWTAFVATLVSELKSFYREPQALAFTLGQPFILLLILNAFDFKFTAPNGEVRPYLDRLLPGLIAFNGMTVGLNSTAFVMSRLKSRGTLRRIRATPIPTGSFIGGVIVSRIVIALGVALVSYFAGVYVFGADLDGSPVLLIALGVLGAAIFIAIGVLMVAIARSEDDMPPMFMLILMPSMLFSGAFLDRAGLPGWLADITSLLPLTYLADAVQRVALVGGGVGDIGKDVLGLLVWGAIGAALASWKFRMA